jgi:hypothetical protein
MALIKLLLAPIRRLVHFPLFQLAVTIAIILWLEAVSGRNLILGQIYNGLDGLVDFSVQRFAAVFELKSFTKSWLTTAFWIGYVYLAGLIILYLIRLMIRGIVEFAARTNAFGLRNPIAQDRGIEAYRAWLPLERIRPQYIPQEKWEAMYAWPPNNAPPYPPLGRRIARGFLLYVVVIAIVAIGLQEFTPFHAVNWLGSLVRLVGGR